MSITTDPRITTPFAAKFTADEVSEGIDLTGKRAISLAAHPGSGWRPPAPSPGSAPRSP